MRWGWFPTSPVSSIKSREGWFPFGLGPRVLHLSEREPMDPHFAAVQQWCGYKNQLTGDHTHPPHLWAETRQHDSQTLVIWPCPGHAFDEQGDVS